MIHAPLIGCSMLKPERAQQQPHGFSFHWLVSNVDLYQRQLEILLSGHVWMEVLVLVCN
jgi:hypothetical protein